MSVCLIFFILYVVLGGLVLPVCMHIFHPNPRQLNRELQNTEVGEGFVATTIKCIDSSVWWLL